MTYHVTCQCGHDLPVELRLCGLTTTCPKCQCTVRVPDSITLQEQCGEKYPLLSPRDRFLKAIEQTEPPFDGTCHRCGSSTAVVKVPVSLQMMTERAVQREGAIQPSLGGFVLRSSEATETWTGVVFPLLLCETCYDQFDHAMRRARERRNAHLLIYAIIFGAFLWLCYHYASVIASLVGVFSLIGAIAWIMLQQRKSKVDPALMSWLERIRGFSETIAAEDEFKLNLGQPTPLSGADTERQS